MTFLIASYRLSHVPRLVKVLGRGLHLNGGARRRRSKDKLIVLREVRGSDLKTMLFDSLNSNISLGSLSVLLQGGATRTDMLFISILLVLHSNIKHRRGLCWSVVSCKLSCR